MKNQILKFLTLSGKVSSHIKHLTGFVKLSVLSTILLAYACHKDYQSPLPDYPQPAAKQNYPITLFEAMARFAELQEAPASSFSGDNDFINLEPVWSQATLSQSLSGKDIVVVPLPDSLLRSLNDGRAGAKLLFSKDGPDIIIAEILVYAADSAYFEAKNHVPEFVDFSGVYIFFDLSQTFKHGLMVENGVPTGKIKSATKSTTSDTATTPREDNNPTEDCIDHVYLQTVQVPCVDIAAIGCSSVINIVFTICHNSSTGGPGGGGGSTGGPSNGPGGNNLSSEFQTLLWSIYNGSLPISVIDNISAVGTYLPAGLTLAGVKMLVDIQSICQFSSAEKHMMDWLQNNSAYIPEIHAFLMNHNVPPPPQTPGNEYVPGSNDKLVAVAVTKAYIQMRQNNTLEMKAYLDDIKQTLVGDPLMDMVLEQLTEALKALLLDLIPGGTFVTNIPVIKQHFEQGDIMEGLWACVTTMLDEGQRALPFLKAVNLTVGIVHIGEKMSDFYQVIKKAEKLGGDAAFKIYQVLRNRLDGLYTKMKWTGNGAKITGAGDPLDIWDDFLVAVNPYEMSGGNGNEIIAKFRIGGNEFILKFYPVSSSDGTPTISVKKGDFEFKMRF